MFVVLCYAHFASQTSGLCSAFPSVPLRVCTLMCLVSLCVLRPTSIGFVQCLHLGSLWNFARVCFYVLRASPRKHRVCAVLFPWPLLSLYACVCHVLLCVLCLTSIGFISAFPSGSPFLNVSVVLLPLSRFVMRIFPRKHRVCAVPFPRPPVKFVSLSLSCYVMRTSPRKQQFCAVLFSRLPFKFTRLYWSCFNNKDDVNCGNTNEMKI